MTQFITKVLNDFDKKSKESFAKGGFLTTDLGDKFRIDIDEQKKFLRVALKKVWNKAVQRSSDVAAVSTCSECKDKSSVSCGGCIGTRRPSNSSVATSIENNLLP